MKNINESGRSMVEMLGVLAIIGVLSIGGIAGYTMAMNRYRANEVIDAASKLAIVNMTQIGTTAAKVADIGITNGSIAGTKCEISCPTAGNGVVNLKKCDTKVVEAIASIAGTAKFKHSADKKNGVFNFDNTVTTTPDDEPAAP